MDQFKKRFRTACDLLVVEDVQFLGGKKATQFELFQTLSHLVDIGARVVLTADRLPGEIAGLEERVRSHMTAGLVATLEAPDALVRREILRSKAASGGVRLPNDCLDLLVDVVRGSVRDLEGALVQLVTTSSLLKRPIDLELTEEGARKGLYAAHDEAAPGCWNHHGDRREALRDHTGRTRIPLAAQGGDGPAPDRDVSMPGATPTNRHRRSPGRSRATTRRWATRRRSSSGGCSRAPPFRYRVEAISARLDELERQPASPQ